jgi:hypothetical protein
MIERGQKKAFRGSLLLFPFHSVGREVRRERERAESRAGARGKGKEGEKRRRRRREGDLECRNSES